LGILVGALFAFDDDLDIPDVLPLLLEDRDDVHGSAPGDTVEDELDGRMPGALPAVLGRASMTIP
jgi:hypothetical protein